MCQLTWCRIRRQLQGIRRQICCHHIRGRRHAIAGGSPQSIQLFIGQAIHARRFLGFFIIRCVHVGDAAFDQVIWTRCQLLVTRIAAVDVINAAIAIGIGGCGQCLHFPHLLLSYVIVIILHEN